MSIDLGTALDTVGIMAKAWDTYNQYGSLADKYRSDARIYANDYDLDMQSAQDARTRGVRDVETVRRAGRSLMGRQKATMGASGVQVGSGSFADVLRDTKANVAEDVSTTWENALREAYGYETSATNARNRQSQAAASSSSASDAQTWGTIGSIVTGIASFF